MDSRFRLRLIATVAASLFALLVAAKETWNVFPVVGPDFEPIRHAALALRHGRSVYGDPGFVYPPTAAVIFLPFGFGSYVTAQHVWLVLSSAAVAVAVVVAVASSRLRIWPLLAAIAVALVMKSDAFVDNVGVGNLSLPLALLAVFVLLSFEEERWTAGCAVLAASLLVKPLLAPFILLPLLRGRWRSLAVTVLPATLLMALAVFAVPGGEHFFSTARYLATGSNLHGKSVFYNLSLRGLAERFDLPGVGFAGRVAVAAIVTVILIAWFRRPKERGTTAAMGTALLLAFMLVGPLSEAHYLLVVAPCLLLALALRRQTRLLAVALPGFLLMIVPRYYFWEVASSPGSLQVRYFLVQVLFLIAAAAVVFALQPGPRQAQPPEPARGLRQASAAQSSGSS